MSYIALIDHFAAHQNLPLHVEQVLGWIRTNTDHTKIDLYPVGRNSQAFRGLCRRRAVPTSLVAYGDGDFEIETQILFGKDLSEDWRRLVITKEALHVFDPEPERINAPEAFKRLVPEVIAPELKGAPFVPAMNDHLGAFRAMAVLVPREARKKLQVAVESNTRSIEDVARYVRLPTFYVDIWLRWGDQLDAALCRMYPAV